MTQWQGAPTRVKAAPSTDDINVVVQHLKYLTDQFALLAKDLEFIINGNLDVKNIRAKSISADRMDVDKLSAITANLGTITAGLMQAVTMVASQIYGTYIATANGTYPRAEMSVTGNFFAVLLDALRYISMRSTGDLGSPQLKFDTGATSGFIQMFSTFDDYLMFGSSADIRFALSNPSSVVRIPSWAKLVNESTGQSLQTALNNKANAGITNTVTVDGKTMVFVNGVLVSVS